jgi:predicted transcriptional regulator
MSLPLVRAAAALEQSDDLHVSRLLILLRAATKSARKPVKPKTVQGIMKLAKLDFLLRYPNCLERVLKARDLIPEEAKVQEYERNNIETKMIRFRYGPWDDRYRRWIGLLVARGLVTTYIDKKTIHVGLTEKGEQIADNIGSLEEFIDLEQRSQLVVEAVGSLSATKLKDFVYQTFPELISMRWGEEIKL